MGSATLFALFLLSALIFYSPSTTAQPVTDGNGKIVTNGGRFYILPHFFGKGGGIELAKTGNETSPLSVVQSPFETDPGQPWIIQSVFFSTFIPEGSIVSIRHEYIKLHDSDESNVWTAVENLPEGTFVKVGYQNTLTGYFSIHRASSPNSYKFLFCTADSSLCGNVGIVKDEAGNRLLAVNQKTPLEFVLAELPSAASK